MPSSQGKRMQPNRMLSTPPNTSEVERKSVVQSVEKSDMSQGKLSYEQKKEQEKLLRKLRKNVEQIEAELADVERQIGEYESRFATATEYNAEEYKAYDELKSRYDYLMHEWEKASYEVEITEQQ